VVLGGSTTVIPAEDGDLLDYLNRSSDCRGWTCSASIRPGPVIDNAQAKLTGTSSTGCCASGRSSRPLATACVRSRDDRAHLRRGAENLHPVPRSRRLAPEELAREGRVRETPERDAPSGWELIR
jgi:hypothetical protein